MDTMKLEPLSGSVIFESEEPLMGEKWGGIIGDLFERIGRRCDSASSSAIIGHIKGISFYSEEKYLKISVISGSHPAEIDFSDGIETSEVKLTINVLVYGLSEYLLENFLKDELLFLQINSPITTTIEQLSTSNHTHCKIIKKIPDGWSSKR